METGLNHGAVVVEDAYEATPTPLDGPFDAHVKLDGERCCYLAED